MLELGTESDILDNDLLVNAVVRLYLRPVRSVRLGSSKMDQLSMHTSKMEFIQLPERIARAHQSWLHPRTAVW